MARHTACSVILAGHLGRALEGEGYSVTLAYDGEEALRLGKTDSFDVMILDVMLPRLDGFTVIRKMREGQLSTQAIIVSARDSMRDVICGLDAGADDYLTKPFALDVLLAGVRPRGRALALLRIQARRRGLPRRGRARSSLRNCPLGRCDNPLPSAMGAASSV